MFGLLKNNDAFTPERLVLECSLSVSSPFIHVKLPYGNEGPCAHNGTQYQEINEFSFLNDRNKNNIK